MGPLKDKEGRTVSSDLEMAELLNSFFVSVFTRDGRTPVTCQILDEKGPTTF